MINYIARVGSAWSQLMNVIIFNGDPNESTSGRVYRENIKWAVTLINTLFFWQNNHCRGAYEKDRKWALGYLSSQRWWE